MSHKFEELEVRKSAGVGLATMLLAASALAAENTKETMAAGLQPSGPWQVTNTEAECRLSREFGSAQNGLTLQIAQGAGSGRYDGIAAGTVVPKLPRHVPLELRLMPQGRVQAIAADSAKIPNHDARFIRWFDADTSIFDALEARQQMTLADGKNLAITLDANGMKAAVAALRTCHERLLQSWGVDTAALKSLRAMPKPDVIPGGGNPGTITALLIATASGLSRRQQEEARAQAAVPPGSWVSADDYPSEALRQEVSGSVTMVLLLNSSGRVENCRVVVSSKFQPLDRRSCEVLSQRAKYAPAQSASGEAVPSTVVERVRWQIPQDFQ